MNVSLRVVVQLLQENFSKLKEELTSVGFESQHLSEQLQNSGREMKTLMEECESTEKQFKEALDASSAKEIELTKSMESVKNCETNMIENEKSCKQKTDAAEALAVQIEKTHKQEVAEIKARNPFRIERP